MSKAKEDYYNFLAYANRRLKDNDINSINEVIAEDTTNYVTELEKKAEMFDEMVKCIATAVDLLGDCNAYYEIGEDILERAKKLQEAGE